ncbi:uncharacterized protein LOC134221474 [Armigeres subalbatus]|uniref:uncharacterized protein LOC134221474 n=1 Tax=Armigeres subalbatus TaxID=124917 RepID=UPI002ED56E8C
MFTVVQFFEKQQLQVLAVPVSWVREGILMWPKIPSNEKLDKMRTEGHEFHGATKKIPVIPSRKYKSLQAAEAAAEELLKQDVSDIETKRNLLKHRKAKPIDPRPLKDYNKIIQGINSSRKVTPTKQIQFNEDPEAGPSKISDAVSSQMLLPSSFVYSSPTNHSQVTPTKRGFWISRKVVHAVPSDARKNDRGLNSPNLTVPLQWRASATHMTEPHPSLKILNPPPTSVMPGHSRSAPKSWNEQTNFAGVTTNGNGVLELSQDQQQFRSIYVTDDNIIYINPPTKNSEVDEASGNLVDTDTSGINVAITSMKSDVEKLGTSVSELKADVILIRNELTSLKGDITDLISTSIRQVVEDCLAKSFPRFAAMVEMDRRDQSTSHDGKLVEEHKLINVEDELVEFNKLLANKQVFEDYVKYFTKIIPPATYWERGDSACYLIVDCLFTRGFWNSFTWTGINRGNKSKRGFREFGNVVQLLLAIVNVGDPTYTNTKLETFCKNRLFRYSKARSSSKLLRKSTCRRMKTKKCEAVQNLDNAVPAVDDEKDDDLMDDVTTDSNQDELEFESDDDVDLKSHVETFMDSSED